MRIPFRLFALVETLPLLLAPSGYQLLSLAAALGMTLLTVTATVI